MAQVGEALTRTSHNNQSLNFCTDGSPVNSFHVEDFIVKINDLTLTLMSRVTSSSKATEEAGEAFVYSVDECQSVYNDVYVATMDARAKML